MLTIGLLLLSNVVMTVAWYGHLKYKASPLWLVIVGATYLMFLK